MPLPFYKMSHQQKQERAKLKRNTLLCFLASGEVYTTVTIVSELLQISERTALRLLQSLEHDKLIKVDQKIIPNSNLKLYGITDHGLSIAGAAENIKPFELGRTNPSYVKHHTQSQHIRIIADRNGWSNWTPEKLLYAPNASRLKKIPDFLMTRPDGLKACGELERYCKSPRRLSVAMSGHLMNILQQRYDLIYYFVPDRAAQERAFNRVKFISLEGNKVALNDTHRSRFKIFEISKWKGEM
jgi:hypothetical protein